MIRSFNSILAISKREFQINYRNFSDILSILIFFLLGILIFVFSVGVNYEIFKNIGIGIIWTLILLSNTLSIKNFFQNDFDDFSILIFHHSGLSYEIIALIKIIIIWLFIQIPFFLVLPIGLLLLNIDMHNLGIIFLSFLKGSIIITCITAISGSINLLNKKNFAIGSLIVMLLSIPVIIFCVGILNGPENVIKAQLNILLGIMLFFLSITPWICGLCIKLSIQNK